VTAQIGIGWFVNHTRSSSTNTQRIRRSREFIHVCLFFGVHEIAALSIFVASFDGQKKENIALAIPSER